MTDSKQQPNYSQQEQKIANLKIATQTNSQRGHHQGNRTHSFSKSSNFFNPQNNYTCKHFNKHKKRVFTPKSDKAG